MHESPLHGLDAARPVPYVTRTRPTDVLQRSRTQSGTGYAGKCLAYANDVLESREVLCRERQVGDLLAAKELYPRATATGKHSAHAPSANPHR
jgi:hypothetical protein